MKIILPVKRVADPNAAVKIRSDTSGVKVDIVRMSLNPFDEAAVEEAVRIKEHGGADEIVVVTIGPNAASDILRTALAMGADRAILVETDLQVQPLAVARILTRICEREKPDLILTGRQSSDNDNAQTGPMLAQMLGWSQSVGASQITLNERLVTVCCEVENGTQTLAVPLPAVITADLHLNQPRYVTLPALMKAKRKPIDIMSVGDFSVDLETPLATVALREPPSRALGIQVQNITQFLDKILTVQGAL